MPKPYEFDPYRIFLGDQSPWFLLEVAFRTVFIFSYTLLLLRMMGKRGLGSLTPFEFAIIVALGSAVGDPMFQADVPLVHTMVVIAIVVGMQQGLSRLVQRSRAVEKMVEDDPRLLVENGAVHVENLHTEQLTRDELFESLRQEGVRQLGEVAFAYLEPSGKLSVISRKPPHPGLSILPEHPDETLEETRSDTVCCGYCGRAVPITSANGACSVCDYDDWRPLTLP